MRWLGFREGFWVLGFGFGEEGGKGQGGREAEEKYVLRFYDRMSEPAVNQASQRGKE